MTHLITKSKDAKKLLKLFEYAKVIGIKLLPFEENEVNEHKALLNAMESSRKDGISDLNINTFVKTLRNGNKTK